MFLDVAQTDPVHYFSWVGFALFSICVHESAHARVAVYFGDETPRDYIALNPKRQMGWFSLIMLCVLGVAWGAVPVDARGVGDRRKNALICLAGPASNLILCALFALLAQTARLWEAEAVHRALLYGSGVNGALCLLNLIPVPPLDGFGAIRSLCTESVEMQQKLGRFAGVGFFLLWMTPVGGLVFEYGSKLATFFYEMWLAPFASFS